MNFRKLITVMVLDWCRNFVSAQYLENKLVEFDQILQFLYTDNILAVINQYFYTQYLDKY